MAEIHETHTVFGPFPDVDPLDTARLFLRTNGYQIVEERRGPPPSQLRVEPLDVEEEPVEAEDVEISEEGDVETPEEDDVESPREDDVEMPDEIITTLIVERGKRGRGWFSSNLTELYTHVELRLEGNKVNVKYLVDAAGQHLWDEEKDFWKREAKALESYLVDQGSLRNMAENERERASEVRRDFVMMGFWIGTLVAILLFMAMITLYRAA